MHSYSNDYNITVNKQLWVRVLRNPPIQIKMVREVVGLVRLRRENAIMKLKIMKEVHNRLRMPKIRNRMNKRNQIRLLTEKKEI